MLLTQDIKLMRRAIKLALKGRGQVSPNPLVGAVIATAEGAILGEGYHACYGKPHAEVAAIASCVGRNIRGSTLYVNLEPCCHQGKTPPCSKTIIEAGIERVVASTGDPNPRVNGCGFEALRKAGIEVDVGILAAEAGYLNRGYFSVKERGRAWCAVKIALSLDGKMAALDGQSKWITGPETRRLAHALRADHDGVLIGGGTVRIDNPELTVRHVKGSNPARIILAPHTGIPEGSRIAETVDTVRTVLVKFDSFDPPGFGSECLEVLRCPARSDGEIDPLQLLKQLPEIGIQSLLIEGGATVLSSFMSADVIDEMWVGVAPSVIGQGISPFEKFTTISWEECPRFVVQKVRRYGRDVVMQLKREI